MDYTKEGEDDDGEGGGRDHLFFIEDSGSSGGEGETEFNLQKHHRSCKRAVELSRERSPPLLLAFSTSSRPGPTSRPTPTSSLDSQEEQEEEDSDQPIEEWMILEREEQVGDSSIQINLCYWNSSDEDEGQT